MAQSSFGGFVAPKPDKRGGGFGGGGAIEFTPGEVIQFNYQNPNNTNSGSYIKKRQIKVGIKGTYRVVFSIRGQHGSVLAYGRIYKNGVAYGTERSVTNSSNVSFSQDLAFEAGDTIEIWLRTANVDWWTSTDVITLKTAETAVFERTDFGG
jgi:hypothetical protein